MTNYIFDTFQHQVGTFVTSLGDSDLIYVGRTAELLTTGIPDAIKIGDSSDRTDDVLVHIYGAVTSVRSASIRADFNESSIIVSQTGLLTGGSYGLTSVGANNVITNHGTVTGSFTGMFIGSVSGTSLITNTGTINTTGTSNNPNVTGGTIEIAGVGAVEIINSGTIVGAVEIGGVVSDTFLEGYDLAISTNTSQVSVQTITNSGDILGSIETFWGDDVIINTGLISGNIEIGRLSNSTAVDDQDLLQNIGTIAGSVSMGAREDVYLGASTAILNGNLAMDHGDDVVTNAGFIGGDVYLGDGDDVYAFHGNGTVMGEIQGGAGNDTITTGATDDRIDGGEDNDRIKSKDGDDTIKGGDGNDNILAGTGDDEIIAGIGDDLVRGGTGDDTLSGGSGKDTLKGGSGDDLIEGGKSKDLLTGGAGADVFLFRVASHSNVANRDTITDFTKGADLIDISAFDAAFISNNAFSSTGAAEVRFGTGGSLTRVEIDIDGNGSTDVRIDLGDIGGLSAADFVL